MTFPGFGSGNDWLDCCKLAVSDDLLQSNLEFQVLPPFFVGNEVPDATARLADTLKVSGVVAFLYAGFCFLLPHTPPKKDGVEKLAFKKAFSLLTRKSFAVLVAASLPVAVIHQIYFMQAGPFFENQLGMLVTYIAPAMTVGQFAEIGFLALLGTLLMRLPQRQSLWALWPTLPATRSGD